MLPAVDREKFAELVEMMPKGGTSTVAAGLDLIIVFYRVIAGVLASL